MVETGEMVNLFDHCTDAVSISDTDYEAIVVPTPAQWIDTDLPLVNTCKGLFGLFCRSELREAYEEQFDLSKGKPVSSIYSLFNGTEFAPFIEVDYSTRLLTGDIGRQIPFTQGTALPLDDSVYQAVPKLSELKEFLKEIDYHGEVLLSLNEEFCLHSIGYGHFYGHMALYNELSSLSPQRLMEWVLGEEDIVELREGVAVGTLVSLCPFPEYSARSLKIKMPSGALKHAWRINYENQEAYLITSYGCTVHEAKRRTRRSIKNCERLHDDLQYRIDYGYKNKFLISSLSDEV